MPTTLIFDFDGTLADSLQVLIDEFHIMSKRQTPLSKSEIQRLRNMHARDVLRELGISLWHVPTLLATGRTRMTKRLGEIKPFVGVDEVLRHFHRTHKLFVVSSNSKTNINRFLKQHDLRQYFTKVYGGIGVFGKAHALRHILRDNKLSAGDCYYIGDEIRDIEAAKKVGLTSVAVGWGYNGPEILQTHQPDYFVATPHDLLVL